MAEDTVELKPCPFCGCSEIRSGELSRRKGEEYCVAWCAKCGVETRHFTTIDAAENAWNNHTPDLKAQRDELLAALNRIWALVDEVEDSADAKIALGRIHTLASIAISKTEGGAS